MFRVLIASLIVISTCGVAGAQTWNEQGDAGETLSTAQACEGSGSLTAIHGNHDFDDCDMYAIDIVDAANFRATVSSDTSFDTQLFLFDESGVGVTHHDDISSTNRRSRLTAQFVADEGRYYLAISGWNKDPRSDQQQYLWNQTPSQIERAPDGPDATSPVDHWFDETGGADGGGSYTIQLLGCAFVDEGDPCPGDLDGSGDVGLQDLATLLANFGRTDSPPPSAGNLDQDGDVDLQDLASLLAVFGTSC